MQIADVDKLPALQIMKGKFDIHGSPEKVWTVKPATGPLARYTINCEYILHHNN